MNTENRDPWARIPSYMRDAKRWLVRVGKTPFYTNGKPRGTPDVETDWEQLDSFEGALHAMEHGRTKGRTSSTPIGTPFDGIGFALGPDGTGNHWQGIDFDHLDEHPELRAMVDSLPGYVEWSPSGAGVHAIGYGKTFKAMGKNDSGIEAYSSGRYFTVTGNAYGGAE